MTPRRPILLAASLSLAALAPMPARAQIPFSEIQDVARAKAEEGLALFSQRRWQEAYERFRIAEDLFHAPTLVLHMAHCQRELGRLLAARALYKKVAEEQPGAGAPEVFLRAKEVAVERLLELDARIPRISIDVPGMRSEGLLVLLDGGPVVALHPADIELDPGNHRIHAAARGVEPLDLEIQVTERERRRIRLDLQPVKPPPPPPAPGSLLPGGISLGLGLAGVAAGAVTGALTLSRVGNLREQCVGARCPDTIQGDADAIRPMAAASNVAFIVGGVGVAAGIVLLIVRPGGGAPAPAKMGLVIGPSGLGGRF